MANQTGTAKSISFGPNRPNLVFAECTAPGAISAAETFTVASPDGIDDDMMPIMAVVASDDATAVYQAMTLTSFNPATGSLVLTVPAAGAVGAGDKVKILYGAKW